MKRLTVATSNLGKLAEIREMLGTDFEVVSAKQAGFTGEIEETGATFYQNALIKAQVVHDALGGAVLADDSGLEVAALGGAPGVFSARYAGVGCGDENNRKLLLKNLAGVTDRSARFVCCMVYIDQNGNVSTATGTTEGRILEREEGGNGFGYDPLFFSYDIGKSFGVASEEEKNGVSHRARALGGIRKKIL